SNIPTIKLNTPEPTLKVEKTLIENLLDSSNYSIENAFEYVLNRKKNSLAESSYKVFKSRINSFLKWIKDQNEDVLQKPITTLTKKTVISYLNEVLEKTSASSRNNTRGDLSAFFQTLVDDDILTENFIKNI